MSKNQSPSDQKRTDTAKNSIKQGQKQNPITNISKKGTTLGAQHASHGDNAATDRKGGGKK